MSKTYEFILRWLPRPFADVALVLWYVVLILAIIHRIAIPFDGFIYWDN
ncbi:MAG: hypothetical protein V3T30_06540 [Thermodesulfobacteriota bacterium]